MTLVPVINSLPAPTIPNNPAIIAAYLQTLSITPSEVTPRPKITNAKNVKIPEVFISSLIPKRDATATAAAIIVYPCLQSSGTVSPCRSFNPKRIPTTEKVQNI